MELENAYLRIKINSRGANFTSIYDKKRNEELLYQPLSNSWSGQDVFIFPFVARLKDGHYFINNQEYKMKNHGLIRYMDGQEEIKDNVLSVKFTYSDQTLRQYPYKFNAEATYKLEDSKIIITYKINNIDDKDMPFMVGGHPGFKLPGQLKEEEFDISGNKLVFDKTHNFQRMDFDIDYHFCNKLVPYINSDTIELNKQLFKKMPTIVLKNDDINYVNLVKTDGSTLRVYCKEAKYLAIWSDDKFGNYVAIEPWNGLPDYIDNPLEFTKKKDMMFLKPNKEYCFYYQIEIL